MLPPAMSGLGELPPDPVEPSLHRKIRMLFRTYPAKRDTALANPGSVRGEFVLEIARQEVERARLIEEQKAAEIAAAAATKEAAIEADPVAKRIQELVDQKKAEASQYIARERNYFLSGYTGGKVGAHYTAGIAQVQQAFLETTGREISREDAIWFVPPLGKTVQSGTWFSKLSASFDKMLDHVVGPELSEMIQGAINDATMGIAGAAAAAGDPQTSQADQALAQAQADAQAQEIPTSVYAAAAAVPAALLLF